MMRTVKKKLSHIEELEKKQMFDMPFSLFDEIYYLMFCFTVKYRQDSNYALSSEQIEKLSRKKGLQAALSKLELFLVRYSRRENATNHEETAQKVDPLNNLKKPVDEKEVVATVENATLLKGKSKKAANPTKIVSKKIVPSSQPPLDFSEWGKLLQQECDVKEKAIANEIPAVIPDAKAAEAEAEASDPSKEQKQWGGWAVKPANGIPPTSYPADGATRPDSTFPRAVSLKDILQEEEAAAAAKAKGGKKASWSEQQSTVALRTTPLSAATPSGRTVLSPPTLSPALPSPAFVHSAGKAAGSVTVAAAKEAASTPTAAMKEVTNQKKGYDLSAFLTSSSPSVAPIQKSSSSSSIDNLPNAPLKAAASSQPSASSASCWATPIKTIKAVDGTQSLNPVGIASSGKAPMSFSAIQEEEERARRNSAQANLKGNELCPWFVDRRPRAESLEGVMKQQSKQKEEELEIQRQMKLFEEMEEEEKTLKKKQQRRRSSKMGSASSKK